MKIAAASCTKIQNLAVQPAWDDIRAARPDALVLLGDNVYLDHDHHDDPQALANELRGLYQRQFAQPQFAALLADLRQRAVPVVAIYDDHDFLGNNRYGGDVGAALREAARAEFVRAFAPNLTGNEVYRLHRLGLVDLVVLDARFHRRSPHHASASDRDAVLGAAQWAWLEQVAAESQAPYLVVASSTTLHRFRDESWEQYPAAFGRLVKLVKARPGRLVLSGDIHSNELYDDSGAIEVVTSAVARTGVVFGAERRNWGLLSFDPQGVRVQLHSLKASGRFDVAMRLADWRLP